MGCAVALPLPWGGREPIFARPLTQVHQTQVKKEENNKESIIDNKKTM